jgi:hypothetical protein
MDISQPFGQTIQDLAKTKEKGEPFGKTVSALAQAKNEFKASLLQASVESSFNAGNEPLSLLYKTALENINEALYAATGQENAIQVAVDQGVDVSPEATAERIVAQSTGFFEQYRAQYSALSEEEAKTQFLEVIKSGIDKGFEEAKSILEGLSVLSGEIADNIDTTYSLVQSGLDLFLNPEEA